MKSTSKHSESQKKRRIWPWIVLVVLLLLILIVRISLRSGLLLDFVKNQIETAANEQIDGMLTIGNLQGDLWNHLFFTGVRVTSDGDLLRVDTLQVRYSPLALIRKTVKLNEIRIVNPVINLEQYADSTWNFERLIPPTEEPDEEPGDLPVRIELDRLELENGYIDLASAHLLPDTTVRIDLINMLISGMFDGDSYEAQLSHLSLQLHDGRLDDPIRFETGISADENTLTLEKLVIATGRTLIEGSGSAATDGGDITFDVDSRPLSWRDIRAYAEESPLVRDVTMGLSVSGNLDHLELRLTASAAGLDNFSLQAGFDLNNDPVLTEARLQIQAFDGALLTGDAEMPSVTGIDFQLSGNLPFASPENAVLDFSGEMANVTVGPRVIDLAEFRGTLADRQLSTEIGIKTKGQTVSGDIVAAAVFSESPAWNVNIAFEAIDPGFWADDPELAGHLSGTITLEGTGFEPAADPWVFHLEMPSGRVAGYEFLTIDIDGRIDRDILETGINLKFADGNIALKATYGWSEDVPGYQLYLTVDGLNLAGLPGFEEMRTDINLQLNGQGRGLNPGTLTLDATLEVGPSMVNEIRIESLTAPVSISGGFIHIDEAELRSGLADGSLFVRQHVGDFVHPENLIEFDLEIRNAGLLSGFTDAEVIQADGSITGTYRHIDNLPQINAELDLSDIRVDTLTASAVKGRLIAVVSDSIPYKVNLLIEDPAYGETMLQNITVDTDGILADETYSGYIRLELITGGNSGLATTAHYHVATDSVEMKIETLTIRDPDRRLDLRSPFSVTYINELARMDNLHLESPDGASLIFYFEQYPGDGFKGIFNGRNINLGHLQSSILGERLFGGIYDGNIEIDYRNDDLFVHIDALVSEFEFDGLNIDSISLSIDVDEQRLDAALKITDDSEDLITGQLSAPFIPRDPATFDESFFDEPVTGSFRMKDTPLSHFSQLLEYYELEGFSGMIGASAEIGGVAGDPFFDGSVYLYDATISNVEIDSTLISWDYNHEIGSLGFSGFVKSLGQSAAVISGAIPFHFNLEQFEFVEPAEEEEISVRLETHDFNLAAFSEFLDPETLSNLRGLLNSEINIRGTMSEPAITGDIRLNNGSVMVIENNISLSNITADISFRDQLLTINRLSAESAGSIELSGTVAFNGFEAGEMDLRAVARNFRVYNTRDLNALITTDTRLGGEVFNPVVTGELRIERGHLYLDNFGERPIEDVVLEEEEEVTDLFAEIFDAMTIEYNLVTERRFWVRNRSRPELALELQGNLDVVKYPGEDVQLFGTMGTSEGYAQQLGKRFELELGDIIFSGPAENPELAIRTLYRIRKPEDIRIWYEISGTVEDPEFAYSSDPEMELQDIISYTLFGRPLHALQGWERSVAGGAGEGTTAADLAMDILMDRVEMLAADRLGFDVIEIDNTRQGGSSGMTVKAGKYMGDRIFLALLQELGGGANSQFIIEYLIRTNLELIFTGSYDYRTGVDLLWKLDY